MYFHIKLLIKSANFIFPVLALTVYFGDFPSLFHCLHFVNLFSSEI